MPDRELAILAWAAVLLGLERIFYVWLSRWPDQFRAAWGARGPSADRLATALVGSWFCAFKLIQAGVFVWWCLAFGQGRLTAAQGEPAVIGAVAIGLGQALNFSVFYRLGSIGVFYGGELGRALPRVQGFPFSVFKHPQYVGAVLSIWGLFLIARFPHDDWWGLPALETAYYVLGAYCERPASELA